MKRFRLKSFHLWPLVFLVLILAAFYLACGAGNREMFVSACTASAAFFVGILVFLLLTIILISNFMKK